MRALWTKAKEKLHTNVCPRPLCFAARPFQMSEYEKGSIMCNNTRRTLGPRDVEGLHVYYTNFKVVVTIQPSYDH
jgi:hypothetical protein